MDRRSPFGLAVLLALAGAAAIGLLLAVLMKWTGLGSGGGYEPPVFDPTVVLEAPAKLGGCAAGDLLPARPGEELAAVCADGGVYVAWRFEEGWAHERVAGLPGEMVQCAIGDARPDLPGLELVCVGSATGGEESGGPGAAWVLSREGGAWSTERIATDTALLHGVAIGELDPARPGPEVLLVGYGRRALLARRGAGGWQTDEVAELPGPGKGAAIAEGRAVIACEDGSLIALRAGANGGATLETLHQADSGYARVAARGTEVVAARDDGALLWLGPSRSGESGSGEVRYRSAEKLRGAVLVDREAGASESPDLATAGYAGSVVWITTPALEPRPTEIYRDTDRLHHLAALQVDGRAALATCGYSGRLVVLTRREDP